MIRGKASGGCIPPTSRGVRHTTSFDGEDHHSAFHAGWLAGNLKKGRHGKERTTPGGRKMAKSRKPAVDDDLVMTIASDDEVRAAAAVRTSPCLCL
jgi:hypothetical protein